MAGYASRSVEALVERQMRNWELGRQQKPAEPAATTPAVFPFVTISRTVGSGGAEVARRLAERVGWPLFDREVLQHMAGDDAVRKRLYETMDERDVGFIEESFRGFTTAEFKRNDYFRRLTETMLAITRMGSAVFLGRGADLILPHTAGLRVRIVASRVMCVQRYAEEHGMDVGRAAREVERLEQERLGFIRTHFNVAADDADRFDLTLSLAAITVEEAVHTITALLQARHMI